MTPDVHVVRASEARYPAFPYSRHGGPVAAALGKLFESWGRDPENPFGDLVGPGARIVIKPNWVRHANPLGFDLDSLVTHTSLLQLLVEHAATALEGEGTVVIGDAPVQGCDFAELRARCRIDEAMAGLRQRHPKLDLRICDWRLTTLAPPGAGGLSRGRQALRPDHDESAARDYRLVDLGERSFLEDLSDHSDRFRVTMYRPSEMQRHHRPGKHEYLVRKDVFGADLLVNVPKMKTHIKAGLTGALKNLVGINGHKEFLPHHIRGAYAAGGDCYAEGGRLQELYDAMYDFTWERYAELSSLGRTALDGALRVVSRLARTSRTGAGSWSGNETIWRTTLDLNRILYFSPDSPAHVITIVDGIVAGQGEGPLTPTPHPAGVLVGGENPALVDAVLARMMGYTIARIPAVYHGLFHRNSPFAVAEGLRFPVTLGRDRVSLEEVPALGFVLPKNWERAGSPAAREARRSGEARSLPR
ncbi:DUF362 domain-containing protein [Anaeromyxobacter oryzisoli]|uniref:DUF362 domain-containing protein n=1 Tax=Anaeromyxobacter oryzisoli TaxID=2925408 RepID=UPI001F563247|nr:DUF362 domain-containing protein [Anaeromyxobacter sp. SG63]